jgi:hypothetical protein
LLNLEGSDYHMPNRKMNFDTGREIGVFPEWVTYAAIGVLILAAVGGIGFMIGTSFGYLPLGAYSNRILEQGDHAGYGFLWVASILVPICLLSVGSGGMVMPWGGAATDRGPWVWLAVAVSCALIGAVRDGSVWQDLFSGPATVRGTVTSSYNNNDEHGTDKNGNSYTYTSYHLTIGGLTFSSGAWAMADIFNRATTGQCAVVTYGPHTHVLVDVAPCRAR